MDFLDFQPLFPEESEEAILARWIEWTNEGLAENDPRQVDTREGSMWRTVNTPVIQEFARLYDLAGAEVPASSNPLSSWGSFLDDLADLYGTERDPATKASGHVEFTGPEGTLIASGLRVESSGTATTEPILFTVTASDTIPKSGTLELPIEAVEAGAAGNVAANAITGATTPLPAGTTVNNVHATTGGLDVESDEHLQRKIEELFLGRAAGTQLDYVIQTRKWLKANYTALAPSGGTVSCIPVWAGAGTVKVIAMDDEGSPLEGKAVEELQAFWDPESLGRGEGMAPVSAQVTVETATVLALAITGKVTLRPGYSLDGHGGTISLQGPLEDVLTRYLLGVEGGSEVIIAQIEGQIVTLEGVEDLAELEVNGHKTNFALTAEPPQVPRLGKLELTE